MGAGVAGSDRPTIAIAIYIAAATVAGGLIGLRLWKNRGFKNRGAHYQFDARDFFLPVPASRRAPARRNATESSS